MASLPLDVLQDIAVYLDTEDLIAAAAVCQPWRRVITTTKRLWQHPHFYVIETLEDGQVPFYPPPAIIAGYLGDLPLRSLHLSGYGERTWYPYFLESISISYLKSSLEGLSLDLGSATNVHPVIHLILDHMSSVHLTHAASFLRNAFIIKKLSIGARADTHQSLTVLGYLAGESPTSSPWEAIESYPAILEYTLNEPRRFALPRSPSRESDEGDIEPERDTHFDVDWQVMERLGSHVNNLTLRLPESLKLNWQFIERPSLVLDKFKCCKISGGIWRIRQPGADPVIEHLSLTDLWGLSCSPHTGDLAFRKLVSVNVRFPERVGPPTWDAIAHFLKYILVENIETIYLELPPNQGQHTGVNAAFNEQISKCHKLRELTLVRYIPATLKAIVKNEAASSSIKRLILANAQLPLCFYEDFTPESLPNLELLDVSKAHPYRRSSTSERQAWVEKWQKVRIADFKASKET